MTGPANAVSVWIETSRVGICEGKAQQFIRRHLEVYGRVAVDAAASERQLAIPSRGVAILASELTSSKSKIRILIRCNKIKLLSREHSIDHRRGFVCRLCNGAFRSTVDSFHRPTWNPAEPCGLRRKRRPMLGIDRAHSSRSRRRRHPMFDHTLLQLVLEICSFRANGFSLKQSIL